MMTLRHSQVRRLDAQAKADFPARVQVHWAAQRAPAAALFSAAELDAIAHKVVAHELAQQPPRCEADIVLAADLWLHELARRRHPPP